MVVNIDTETYKIEEKNFYKTEYEKTMIILGDSLRKDNHHIIHLKRKDYGYSTKWPTFSITRSGKIYQHFNPKGYSDYFGEKEIDKKSISIVLENMGMVYFDSETQKYLNWTNDICPDDRVFERPWKGNRYWERYTTEQYQATAKLCGYLCEKYGIKLDSYGHNSHEEHSNEFEGILSKSNFDMDFTDLNPSFAMKDLLQTINAIKNESTK